MFRLLRAILWFFACLLSCSVSSTADNRLSKAYALFTQGDEKEALLLWEGLASEGNVYAKFNLISAHRHIGSQRYADTQNVLAELGSIRGHLDRANHRYAIELIRQKTMPEFDKGMEVLVAMGGGNTDNFRLDKVSSYSGEYEYQKIWQAYTGKKHTAGYNFHFYLPKDVSRVFSDGLYVSDGQFRGYSGGQRHTLTKSDLVSLKTNSSRYAGCLLFAKRSAAKVAMFAAAIDPDKIFSIEEVEVLKRCASTKWPEFVDLHAFYLNYIGGDYKDTVDLYRYLDSIGYFQSVYNRVPFSFADEKMNLQEKYDEVLLGLSQLVLLKPDHHYARFLYYKLLIIHGGEDGFILGAKGLMELSTIAWGGREFSNVFLLNILKSWPYIEGYEKYLSQSISVEHWLEIADKGGETRLDVSLCAYYWDFFRASNLYYDKYLVACKAEAEGLKDGTAMIIYAHFLQRNLKYSDAFYWLKLVEVLGAPYNKKLGFELRKMLGQVSLHLTDLEVEKLAALAARNGVEL